MAAVILSAQISRKMIVFMKTSSLVLLGLSWIYFCRGCDGETWAISQKFIIRWHVHFICKDHSSQIQPRSLLMFLFSWQPVSVSEHKHIWLWRSRVWITPSAGHLWCMLYHTRSGSIRTPNYNFCRSRRLPVMTLNSSPSPLQRGPRATFIIDQSVW